MPVTVQPVAPKVFKKFAVVFPGEAGADTDYAPAVASCAFTPSSSIQTWKGGTPDAVFTDVTSPTYVCDMKVGQDWTTDGSLALYLFNHQGEEIAGVKFTPIEGGPTFVADLILGPVAIGGDIDAWGESTIQHAVNGKPTIAPVA